MADSTKTSNMFSLLDGEKPAAPAAPAGGASADSGISQKQPGSQASQRSQNGERRGKSHPPLALVPPASGILTLPLPLSLRGSPWSPIAGGRGGRGRGGRGRGREYERRSGTGRGNRLGYENKKGGGGKGNWGAPGEDAPGNDKPADPNAEAEAEAEVVEEPDNTLGLDDYMKKQAETKKKLAELTGAKSASVVVDDFKGLSMKKSKKEGDTTSDWSAFEAGSKKGKTKNRKEKQTLIAGFRIKDDYEPRERRGDKGGRGGRGGREGRGGRGGGRGGFAARLDSASDFPTLG